MRLTLDLFSGPPNPVVEVGGEEAWAILERLQPRQRLEESKEEISGGSWLGYRGVAIETTEDERVDSDSPLTFRLFGGNLVGPGLSHKLKDAEIEHFICSAKGPFGKLDFPDPFFQRLKRQVDYAKSLPRWEERSAELPWTYWEGLPSGCENAPVYAPKWWNRRDVVDRNNCYAYATNYRSDTRAEPGTAAGRTYVSFTCDAIIAAAVADGLVDAPDADNRCPAAGHLVALLVDDPYDWHWLRKDRDGLWSHKPGSTPVTNLDWYNQPILDPRTAAFFSHAAILGGDLVPYAFCGFMVVPPAIRIA